ncbi:LANO_0D09076g1_1 [Lachancea nothofagi CBS 11611]|uniref:Structural maintenance of chromosomes protein 5 n=1 Tax=Lachancea nothofagi CBS 11611 TaxID=1266666 RepID=A0A1G4JJD6_9SACH|nr:LANO_0D09076g1_1 [Lachancea nothofagi CBS 11611]
MNGSNNNEHDTRRPKRLKIAAEDLTQFKAGSIVKLKLVNFVTYAMSEFCMSPSLNMIIGPNGSGKSTFVCGVCLGLAGKPEYIGRSKKVEDFIKSGESKSVIETTLKRDSNGTEADYVDENFTTKVTRVMHRNKKKSEYFLNDEPVEESVVKRLILSLNIQLDNLCQFLSQERVQEFARLKSDKLLIETVRSVDIKMVDIFEELKELQQEGIEETKELEQKESRMRELAVTREKLEASVRALETFQKKKLELTLHEKLLPYVKVKDHKLRIKEYKKLCEATKGQLRSLLSDKKPFKNTLDRIGSVTAEKQQVKDDLEENFKNTKEKFPKYLAKLEKYTNDIETIQHKVNYYEGRTEMIKKSIEATKQQLSSEKEKLASMNAPDESLLETITADRAVINESILELQSETRDLSTSADGIRHQIESRKRYLQKQLQSLNSNDRIDILHGKGRKFDEVRKAVLFIRSRPEMSGKVLEPPIMAVSAKRPEYAAYLGTCTDFSTAIALTMVDSQAYDSFNDEILRNFRVNLRELSPQQVTSPYPHSELQKMGFDAYLSDFLTGDSNVLKMLCQQHRLHTIPVSRQELSPRMFEFLRTPDRSGNLRFRRVIAGNYIYDFKRSAYGNRQIFSVDFKVRPCQFYQGYVLSDERRTEIDREIAHVKEQIRGNENEIGKIMESIQEKKSQIISKNEEDKSLRGRATHINNQRVIITKTKRVVQTLEEKLGSLKNESRLDAKTKIKECQRNIEHAMQGKVEHMREITRYIEKLQAVEKELNSATIAFIEALNSERSMNDVVGFFNEKEEQLRKEYEESKKNYASMKDTTEYQGWIAAIRQYSNVDKDQLAALAEQHQTSGNFNLHFVLGTIDRLNSELAVLNQDESVLEIMRQTEDELAILRNTVPQKKEALLELRSQMATKRSVLEPMLDSTIDKISKNFGRLFKNVGSAGAVQLDKHELYKEWKIEIMVKFRDSASLKKLDSHTQSGGEKAVSTVLYMIALQEFTSAPFRVVDEINQGMDSRNERIVHKAMVENACVENTSQYILITPKLLTQLYYHENVRIHCVMAGAWIPNPIVDHDKIQFGRTTRYVF